MVSRNIPVVKCAGSINLTTHVHTHAHAHARTRNSLTNTDCKTRTPYFLWSTVWINCASDQLRFFCMQRHNPFISGKDCKTNVDECKQHSPCQNGATCKDKIADYQCVCAEGWTGRNCAVDINECELGFCQNGATCKNSNGSYTCSCVPGYTDRNCSTDIDDCESVPCEHNSTCYDLVNDFNCSCEIGYTGECWLMQRILWR